jgi:signal transduction histidine kinase
MATFDLAHLGETVAAALVAELELERAAVWQWDKRRGSLCLAAWAGEWSTPPPATLPSDLLRREGSHAPWRMNEGIAVAGLNDNEQERVIEVLAPLWATGNLVGALALGKRWDDEIFDERDMEVVDIITQQTTLLLLTASHIQRVRRFPSEIAAAQESERLKIAQELHDTVQQFLGRLPFLLEVSRQKAMKEPEETQAILEHCLTEVECAAATVRDLRNNLAPRHLEQGLSRPLELLVEKFRARTAMSTQVKVSPAVDAAISLEMRHALYRVIQQALDNAAAHAQASRVTVAVTLDGSRVLFSVVDDGCGFSEEDRRRAEERGSFGLRSMDARITSLQGVLAFGPSEPSGTRISGWLPVEPGRDAG